MEKNYTKLKKVIQDSNPSIMKLENGCRIDVHNKNLKNSIHIYCGKDLYNSKNYIALLKEGDYVSMCLEDVVKEKNGIEIIGKPITLENVMVALEGVRKLNRDRFIFDSIWEKGKDLDWHYKNEPGTIKFLIKLLIK